MKLSIVIVNYNAQDFLIKCLRSIQTAIKLLEYEVIVVDNGSIEKSEDLIKNEFPMIKFIANQINKGFPKASNQGIRISKGEYILLLNPDTVILPNTIEQCISFLDTNPQVAVVTCYVELATGQIDPACHRGFPTPWASLCYFLGLEKLFPKSRLFSRYHLGWLPLNIRHEIDTPSGCFYLVKRSVLNEVGLLDEDYFLYFEEVDLSYRIKEKGWKIFFLPEVKIIHYKGISSGIKKDTKHMSKATKETKKLAINSFCNSMKLFYDKHYKGKYPKVIDWLMYLGIEVKRFLSLWQLRI
jgi:GT2 family glycosyltransferase